MSTDSNFDFELTRETFDSSLLEKLVFWPTIDEYSRRDWRKKCIPAQQLLFPAARQIGDLLVHTRLHARCDDVAVFEEEGTKHTYKSIKAGVRLITPLEEGMSDAVVRLVAENDDISENPVNALLEDDVPLQAMIVKSFNFDGGLPLVIGSQQIIVNPAYDIVWLGEDTYGPEDENHAPQPLDNLELEEFERALYILDVPMSIMKNLDTIRQNPLS